MANLNLQISNIGPSGTATRNYDVAAKPLDTTTLGINLDKSNDYSVALNFGEQKAFITPTQAQAFKLIAASASRNEMLSETDSVSLTINNKTYSMPAAEMLRQLP